MTSIHFKALPLPLTKASAAEPATVLTSPSQQTTPVQKRSRASSAMETGCGELTPTPARKRRSEADGRFLMLALDRRLNALASKNDRQPGFPSAPCAWPERAPCWEALTCRAGAPNEKIRLDTLEARERLFGSRAAAFERLLRPVAQYIDTADGLQLEPRPFRLSALPENEDHALALMGPTRETGFVGKIRDGLLISRNGGPPTPVVLKEWRLQPSRASRTHEDGSEERKPSENRLGRKRNSPISQDPDRCLELIHHEVELCQRLHGSVGFFGSRQVGSKFYMFMGAMDLSLFDALSMLMKPPMEHRISRRQIRSFARHVGHQLMAHLADIHAQGYVHVDGKQENSMLRLATMQAALVDFGGADRWYEHGTGDRPAIRATTYLSPDMVSGSPVTPASDTWLLGIQILEILANIDYPLMLKSYASTRWDALSLHRNNVQRVSEFTDYRNRLLSDVNQEGLPPTGRVLRRPLLLGGPTPIAQFLSKAGDTDVFLTSFLLENVLSADPLERVSSAAAARLLGELSNGLADDAQHVFSFLQQTASCGQEIPHRLQQVADFISNDTT